MACCDCCKSKKSQKLDLDEPRFDQESYLGRVRHFFSATNPKYLFVSNRRLEDASYIVDRYVCDEGLPDGCTEDDLWKAKTLYDSTYDPNTGEKKSFLTRPSSYVFLKTLIFGGMLSFYETIPGLAFWQIVNQSFNTLVHLNNRIDEPAPSTKQLSVSYICATGAAVYSAVILNKYLQKINASKLAFRLIPFGAVAAANAISIPILRAQELKMGRPIYDDVEKVGHSKVAANLAVTGDVASKIIKVAPPLVITPVVMDYLEKRGTLCRYPWMQGPVPLSLLFLSLTFLSPLVGAFFKPKVSIPFKHIEHDVRCRLTRKKYCCKPPYFVYYKTGSPIPY